MNWISVKDKLPGPYSVLTYNARRHRDSGLGYSIGVHVLVHDDAIGDWWMGSDNWFLEDNAITHWMPLPEPPGG